MTKNRITIILTALAVTIGAMPATSTAKPNNGGFSRSIEGNKKPPFRGFCSDTRALSEGSLADMQTAIQAGDYAASFKALDQSAKIRGEAKKAGCAWAWV